MSRFSYGIHTCKCGKRMKGAGFAIHAHEMAHVRKGEMVVIQSWLNPDSKRRVWTDRLDKFNPDNWQVIEDHRGQA